MKDVHTQEGSCSVRTVFGHGLIFRYGRPHFLVKNLGFFKIMVCPHRQGGG